MATKAEKTAAPTAVTVIALVAVEHDQVRYGPAEEAGEEFDLTMARATPLLAVGAVKLKDTAEA